MRTSAAQAIRRRARVVRQNLWMILGVGTVFAVVGNITQPAPEKRFLAGAQVDPGGVQEQVLLVYEFAAKPAPLKQRVTEAADSVLTREVLTNAAVRLGRVPDDIEIDAGSAGLSGRVGIVVESGDPRQASRVANAVAEEYVKVRNAEYRDRIAEISKELRAARKEAGIPPRGVDILADLTRYGTEQYQRRLDMLKEFAEPAIVAKRATVPTAPVAQLPWAGMIFILGVGLALTAAFLREALRKRREDPVLAADMAGLEPVGSLRRDELGAAAALVSGPGRIAVCGLRPGPRPLAAALLLATVAARHGRTVVLLEAETGRPRLARSLRLPPRPGAGEVLDGRATLEEALQPTVDVQGGAGPVVVPAGSAEASHPEGCEALVRELTLRFEVVVVASPSPLESAELALLGPQVDSILVVAESGARADDELRAIGAAVRRLGLPAGLVLADATVEDALVRSTLVAPAGTDRPLQGAVA